MSPTYALRYSTPPRRLRILSDLDHNFLLQHDAPGANRAKALSMTGRKSDNFAGATPRCPGRIGAGSGRLSTRPGANS